MNNILIHILYDIRVFNYFANMIKEKNVKMSTYVFKLSQAFYDVAIFPIVPSLDALI